MSDEPQNLDPSAVPPEDAPEEPEPAPEPAFNAEEAFGHLVGQVGELREAVGQLFQAPMPDQVGQPEPQYGDDWDPFDPNAFQGAVGQAVQQQLSPIVEALQPLVERQRDEASEQYVSGVFDRLGVPEDLQNDVLIMSGGFRLAGQSPEQAIYSAYQSIQGLKGAGVSQGRQDQKDELEQIVGAPGVTPSTHPGAVASQSRPASMEEAAKRIAAKMGIS